MKRVIKWLPLLVIMAGCGAKVNVDGKPEAETSLLSRLDPPDILCENKPYSQDDLDSAALKVLFPKLIYINTLNHVPLEDIVSAENRLKAVREWTDKEVTNPRIKSAYTKWMDSYARDYDEVRAKLKDGPHLDTQLEIDKRESEQRDARADALAKCLPVPK